MHALVVVLGDLGRSPRMLAHAGSLLRAGYTVHLIGTARTPLPPFLRAHEGVHLHPLSDEGAGGGAGVRAAMATATRGLRLGVRLAVALFRRTPRPDLILVQCPPAVPVLPVALLAARMRRTRLVVDWHNLGWTLLALRFGSGHPLVRVTRLVELWSGTGADAHLAVSRALARRLGECGMGDVEVLHDGPSPVRPVVPARRDLPADPMVVTAPMGWTRDDDLPLLAEALGRLGGLLEAEERPGSVRVVVSGNGPLRAEWEGRLRGLGGARLVVETPDVPVEAYPELLASSHMGLCVHRSSSGLDLPMKVVEMMAAELPVLALDAGGPLDEIAPEGRGVLRFDTAEALAARLHEAVLEARSTSGLLARLTAEARAGQAEPWDARWEEVVAPLLG